MEIGRKTRCLPKHWRSQRFTFESFPLQSKLSDLKHLGMCTSKFIKIKNSIHTTTTLFLFILQQQRSQTKHLISFYLSCTQKNRRVCLQHAPPIFPSFFPSYYLFPFFSFFFSHSFPKVQTRRVESQCGRREQEKMINI